MIKLRAKPLEKRLLGRRAGSWQPILGAIAAFPLMLGGCESPFFSDEQLEPQRIEVTGKRATDPSFPNLSSVPNEAPLPSTSVQRNEKIAVLSADREKARFSTDPLAPRSGAAVDDPAYPPPPTIDGQGDDQDGARAEQLAGLEAAPRQQIGAGQLIGVIYFAHGSVGLSQRDLEVLRDVAALQSIEDRTLRVVGHASAQAGALEATEHEQANQRVSLQRANAVARALDGYGVDEARVIVEGRGANQPVYEESTTAGEAGNRRVEIFLQ